jgi:hypothetical protein
MQGQSQRAKRNSRVAGALGASALTAALLASVAAPAAAEETLVIERVPHSRGAFGPDPRYPGSYDTKQQIDIYGGKKNIDEPRPLIEAWEPMYREGPLQPNYDIVGRKNLVAPAFALYGDWRTAVAYNDNGKGKRVGQIATRLNLEADLQFTATERIHALFRPLDRNGRFTRYEFFGPDADHRGHLEFDWVPRTFFFEGDLGNIVAGFSDRYQKWDLPFTFGLVPLIFQNGIWVNSAMAGAAFSIVGRNSPAFNISNMDFTFFGGGDQVTTPAVKDANGNLVKHGLAVYGMNVFIEANEGYWEIGGGVIHDYRNDPFGDKSYASATVAFTKRYFGWLSNSWRGIAAFGQDRQSNGKRTADGIILLMENSLISPQPLVLVPYANAFVGFGQPQSLMRNGDAGGVLFNTGILFQTDGLTGYPKLDDTGHYTYGGAVGVNYLFNLEQQIVLEAATVQVHGPNDPVVRPARGAQYGLGARYQRNLTKAWLFRADVMYAWRDNQDNIAGIRAEVRQKF